MPYQIYRIGEWERVGGVEGYSTIRAYLQSGLYETEAYARKKATRLADQDYESGGDGSFEVIATGESPRDIVRTRDAEARAAEKQSPHEGRGA
jgi:hypothetical protein